MSGFEEAFGCTVRSPYWGTGVTTASSQPSFPCSLDQGQFGVKAGVACSVQWTSEVQPGSHALPFSFVFLLSSTGFQAVDLGLGEAFPVKGSDMESGKPRESLGMNS